MTLVKVERALLSVSDKTDLVPFAQRLADAGVEIVSSGGTATALEAAGLPVTRVSEVTGAPEILGGRVKTLHPHIHGGILARLDQEEDVSDLHRQGIIPFQLVVVNLYPFRETVANPDATSSQIIERIDIGGPAMIRAAAKNHRYVGVVCTPTHYQVVADAVETGGLDDELRRQLAAEAFFQTASYDAAIVDWLGEDLVLPLRRFSSLRYGENPHQDAVIYAEDGAAPWWLAAQQHQGKEMSFNNYADADAACRLVADLDPPAVAVVKHMNPAGVACGAPSMVETFERAWAGDSLAAFGGVVAVNGTLDEPTAGAIAERFVEVVVATDADQGALELLSTKTNLRVLTAPLPSGADRDYRRVEQGLLAQARDFIANEPWEVVSDRKPTPEEEEALRFAWVVSAHTKSNAIVIANGTQAVGVGAGDQSRVGAAERAVVRAGDRARGGVAASDAFFPFRDGLDALAAAGVTAVIEPGGSRNDREVVDAANEHGMALVFTATRHFRH